MDGSRLDSIKTPKVERVLLRQYNHAKRDYVTGTLCLTDRHLIFIEPTGKQETWVLYHHMSSVEREQLTTKGYPLVIETKTFQEIRLIIPRESDCVDIMDTIKVFSQPENYTDLFAYHYKPKEGELIRQSSGWALYDTISEYGRMGVPNEHWRATALNETYQLCETYCSTLFVPAKADDSVVSASAKFRSKGRIPALSYYYKPTQSTLCRCSQPLVGLTTNRSAEDEQLLQAIIDVNPNSEVLHVVDTRPKVNAMANKAAGKGYETADNYSNMVFDFFNIQNIHIMRESLQKMIEAVISPNQTMSGMLSGLENSGWLKHIHLILEVAVFTAKIISQDKTSVLIHCSDGWDRTAQTCALACLLLDHYYRTLHGFMVLIEKEWLAFGHKISIRSGHLAGEARETSPIMTQFLECVWQVMVQYPTAFQFNEHFLVTLHDHLYSCQFGTFLGNCEKERLDLGFRNDTYSLWGHVWAHLDDYLNPLYTEHQGVIFPNTDIPQLSFWTGLYCQHSLKHQVCEMADEVTASIHQQNYCISEHIKHLEQKLSQLKTALAWYKEKLGPGSTDKLPESSSQLNSLDGIQQSSVDDPQQSTIDDPQQSDPQQCNSHIDDSQQSSIDNPQQCDPHIDDPQQSSIDEGVRTQTLNDPEAKNVQDNSTLNSDKSVSLERNFSKTKSEVLPISNELDQAPVTEDGNQDTASTNQKFTGTNQDLSTINQNPTDTKQDSTNVSHDSTDTKQGLIDTEQSLIDTEQDPTNTNNDLPDTNEVPTDTIQVPIDTRQDPTDCLSPDSYSKFKEFLHHTPDLNLPWQPMRSVSQCICGMAFSYSRRKYHCSYCGVVVCSSCSSYQALPWLASSKPQRMCKDCFKLMRKRHQEEFGLET